jgi:hypothetical protein
MKDLRIFTVAVEMRVATLERLNARAKGRPLACVIEELAWGPARPRMKRGIPRFSRRFGMGVRGAHLDQGFVAAPKPTTRRP